MQFSAEARALAAAISRCAAIADGNSPVPICRTIRIQATDGGLTITGTSAVTMTRLDIGIPAEVGAPGACCIDAEDAARWAGRLQDGAQVAVTEPEDWTISAQSGRTRHAFKTMPPHGFLELANGLKMDGSDAVEIECAALAEVLQRAVKFAAPPREPREYLTGIKLEADGSIVATTGVTLYADKVHSGTECLIPRGALKPILPVLALGDVATMATGDGVVSIECAEARLRFAQLAYDFPDWWRIIPDADRVAIFNRDELLEAIRAASLGTAGAMEFRAADGEIVVRHERSRSGEREPTLLLGSGEAAADAEVLKDHTARIAADIAQTCVSAMPPGSVAWEADEGGRTNLFRPLPGGDRITLAAGMR